MTNTNELSTIMRKLTVDPEQSVTKTASSVAQALSTPELLEGILSYLPVLDLVVATGVNKTFRNVIKTSPELQRKLFMLPSKKQEKFWPLVEQKPDPEGESIANYDWAHSERSSQVVSVCPFLDPMDEALFKSLGSTSVWKSLRHSPDPSCPRSLWSTWTILRFNAKRLCAVGEAWASMFITNPPRQQALVDLIFEGHVDGKLRMPWIVWDKRKIYRKEGITVTFLVDELPKRKCMVQTVTSRSIPLDENNCPKYYGYVDNTSLYDEIAKMKKKVSGLEVQISARSRILLPSTVTPTDSEYNEMALHGQVANPMHAEAAMQMNG